VIITAGEDGFLIDWVPSIGVKVNRKLMLWICFCLSSSFHLSFLLKRLNKFNLMRPFNALLKFQQSKIVLHCFQLQTTDLFESWDLFPICICPLSFQFLWRFPQTSNVFYLLNFDGFLENLILLPLIRNYNSEK
jgi:hypothetical protein